MILDTLIVGDTLDFLTTVADYPPANGWTLKYRLVPRVSGTPIDLTAGNSGSDYRVQVSPTTTATWTAGEYSWSSWVEKSGARYTVDEGLVTLKADPATIASYDGRSPARKALDALNAGLETFGSNAHVQGYSIEGREMKYRTFADFMAARDRLVAEVNREENATRTAAGLASKNRLRVVFR